MEPITSSTRTVKIPHQVLVKSPGLLPMLYRIPELAGDLDLPEPTLRAWLTAGAPHQRDERGHIWVNGRGFADWVVAQSGSKAVRHLDNDQAYCLRCKMVVQLHDPAILPGKGKQIYLRGTCEFCGATINRGGRNGKSS